MAKACLENGRFAQAGSPGKEFAREMELLGIFQDHPLFSQVCSRDFSVPGWQD